MQFDVIFEKFEKDCLDLQLCTQCGQAAKISPPAPAASELLDIMQATQPHQQCHALQPQDMSTEDKLVLSPIVFQGKS